MRGYWFDNNSGNSRFNRHYQNAGAASFTGDWTKIIGKWVDGKLYLWAPYYTFVPDNTTIPYKQYVVFAGQNQTISLDAPSARAVATVESVYKKTNGKTKWVAVYRLHGQLVPRLPSTDPKAVFPTIDGKIFYNYASPRQVPESIASWGITSTQRPPTRDSLNKYSLLNMGTMQSEWPHDGLTPIDPPIGEKIGGWLAPTVYNYVLYESDTTTDDNPNPSLYVSPVEGDPNDLVKKIEYRNNNVRKRLGTGWVIRDYNIDPTYSDNIGITDPPARLYYWPASVSHGRVMTLMNLFAVAKQSTDTHSGGYFLPGSMLEIDDPNVVFEGASWGPTIQVGGES